jgi:hypothetical protein
MKKLANGQVQGLRDELCVLHKEGWPRLSKKWRTVESLHIHKMWVQQSKTLFRVCIKNILHVSSVLRGKLFGSQLL